MKKIRQILCFLFFAGFAFMSAQEVHVDAVLDTSRIRIGEQAKVDIYVSYNSTLKDLRIQWPSIGDTLSSKVEVLSVSPIDTTFPDKTNSARVFQHQQLIVSVYDSGFYAIPPLRFILNNDSSKSVYTRPMLLQVHTVPTDTSAKKIKDIKTVMNEPFNWKWYINYIYFGAAVVILTIAVILLLRYYSRKRKQQAVEPPKPKVPPHITALATLERIREEEIWKEGRYKEYYSAISDAVRLYIEERFNVHALESTTDEIMLAFRSQVVDKESKEKLQQLLTLSDLVKFAKQTPVEVEHNFTLQNAFDFVNGTKREDEPSEASVTVSNPSPQ